MLPWTELRIISKSFTRCFLFVFVCLKRSVEHFFPHNVLFPLFFLRNCCEKKKKKHAFTGKRKEKNGSIFFFWSKAVLGQKKAKTNWLFLFLSVATLVSFLLPLFLTPNILFNNKTKTICLSEPFFFWQMRKTKRPKNFLFVLKPLPRLAVAESDRDRDRDGKPRPQTATVRNIFILGHWHRSLSCYIIQSFGLIERLIGSTHD